MEKIGFIGSYDKSDFIIYLAKMLVELNKKVIVIDSTINQKMKYIIPAINPTTSYVTDYENIDFAIGFRSFEDLNNYLMIDNLEDNGYDFVLIDIDSADALESFGMQIADKNYFATSFDLYSLKKGVEILDGIVITVTLTKILFSNERNNEDNEYLNYLSMGKKVKWEEERIYVPKIKEDEEIILENEKKEKISFRKLSSLYKEALMCVANQILKYDETTNMKRILKQI